MLIILLFTLIFIIKIYSLNFSNQRNIYESSSQSTFLLLNRNLFLIKTSPKFCSEKEERSFSSIGRFSMQPEVNKDRSLNLTKSL